MKALIEVLHRHTIIDRKWNNCIQPEFVLRRMHAYPLLPPPPTTTGLNPYRVSEIRLRIVQEQRQKSSAKTNIGTYLAWIQVPNTLLPQDRSHVRAIRQSAAVAETTLDGQAIFTHGHLQHATLMAEKRFRKRSNITWSRSGGHEWKKSCMQTLFHWRLFYSAQFPFFHRK